MQVFLSPYAWPADSNISRFVRSYVASALWRIGFRKSFSVTNRFTCIGHINAFVMYLPIQTQILEEKGASITTMIARLWYTGRYWSAQSSFLNYLEASKYRSYETY
jgi:hypothetical protein